MSKRSRQRRLWSLVLVGFGGLLLLSAFVWYVFFSDQATTTDEIVNATTQPYPEVERISAAKAKAAFDEGSAVFLDVRDSEAYAQGHIPGAILLPLSEVPARVGELDPNAWIITYCT